MTLRIRHLLLSAAIAASSFSLFGDIAATIKYCDRNTERAISNAVANVEFVLPNLVSNEMDRIADRYIPKVITNTVIEVDVQVFSNITTDVVFHTNIIDNVISNYISNYYHTNYIDNVISNYYHTNYITSVHTNIVQNDYYTTNHNTIITHNVHYSTHVITGEVYNITTTNHVNLNVNATITNGATYYVASLTTNTAISGDLNVYSTSSSGGNVVIQGNPIDRLITKNSIGEILEEHDSVNMNLQSYYLYGTNQLKAISGDLGVYSTTRDTKYHSAIPYWDKLVDQTDESVYVFVDYTGNSSNRKIRYRRLNGPTQTGSYSAAYGNVIPYYYGGLSLWYTSSGFTVFMFDDTGTRKNSTSSDFSAATINNGGYWQVGTSKISAPYTYKVVNKIGTLATSEETDEINLKIDNEILNSLPSPNRTFLVSSNGVTALFGDLSINSCVTEPNTNGYGYAKYYTASDGSLYVFSGTFTTTSGYYRYGAVYRNSEYMELPLITSSNGFSWYGYGIVIAWYWSGSSTSSGRWRICKHGGTADYFDYLNINSKHQDVYGLQYRIGGTSSGQLVTINLFESKHTRANGVIDRIPTWNSITNWIESNFQRR